MAKRILVVDDDDWILKAVAAALTPQGFRVDTARNGKEGVSAAQAFPPDLIISDVTMPVMDGWTFVKRIRTIPELAFVPVIFLTSHDANRDFIQGFRMGADDYVPKPFDPQSLGKRIYNALDRRQEIEELVKERPKVQATMNSMKGTFDQVGLASLLTALELSHREGILSIKSEKDGVEGRIFLVKGEPWRAELHGKKKLENEEAVYRLLGCATGSYEFSPMTLRVTNEIRTPGPQLLLEAARRIDEARR